MQKIVKNYFQKSRWFLYPILGHSTSSRLEPLETYVLNKTVEENTLDDTYAQEAELYKNPFFKTFSEIGDFSIFVFSFKETDHSRDFENFVAGKYSKFTEAAKSKILEYYAGTSDHELFEGYLYPETAYKDVSYLLGEGIHILKSVVELCNIPDLEKELVTGRRIMKLVTQKSEI
jgi:hypothetical protein